MAEPVKFKFSNKFEAVRSRLRRLPKVTEDALDSQAKKDAYNVIKEFQVGIRRNNFGLTRLSPITVKLKKNQGKPRPYTALYGDGDGKKNSLINALAVRKIKNGYRVYRRIAKHYKANLTLKALLSIHENGAVIPVTLRMRGYLHFLGIHLSKNTMMIRIPPRPVVDKAIKRMLQKRKKADPNDKIRKALNKLIKKGDESMIKKLTGYSERGGAP